MLVCTASLRRRLPRGLGFLLPTFPRHLLKHVQRDRRRHLGVDPRAIHRLAVLVGACCLRLRRRFRCRRRAALAQEGVDGAQGSRAAGSGLGSSGNLRKQVTASGWGCGCGRGRGRARSRSGGLHAPQLRSRGNLGKQVAAAACTWRPRSAAVACGAVRLRWRRRRHRLWWRARRRRWYSLLPLRRW